MKKPIPTRGKSSSKTTPVRSTKKEPQDDLDLGTNDDGDGSDDADEVEETKPVRSAKASKKPVAKAKREDDEDDESIEDVDDEDDEPVKKATKKPIAKAKLEKEDEEEDEQPVKQKRRAVDNDGVDSEKRARRKKFGLNDVPGAVDRKDWTDKLQILGRDEIVKATTSRSKGILIRLFSPEERGEESIIVSSIWPNFEKSDGKVSGRKFTFHPDDCNDAVYPEDDWELVELCKEYGYNPTQEMFIPVIVRDKQEELGELPEPSKSELKTGYQDLDDPTPSPVYLLRLSKKVFNDKIKSLVVQVKTSKGGRGSSVESFPIWHPKHGKDILLTCTYDKSKAPTDRYEWGASPQDKTPLTEEEEAYLIPDAMAALDESLSKDDRKYEASQFLKENIIPNKFAKDDKKKPASKSGRRHEDDEDMYENKKPAKKTSRRPVVEDDEEDEDLEDAFGSDEDEDDGPKRPARKASRKPVVEDEEDEDEDEEDEKPRRPAKKTQAKRKPAVEDDEEDDEMPF